MDRRRLLAAVVIVPLADAVAALAVVPPPAAVGAAIIGLIVMLSGGLPAFYWLVRRGPVTFRQIVVAGLALGNVPLAIYAVALIPYALLHLALGTLGDHWISVSQLLAGSLRPIGVGAAMGMMSAVVFWFTAVHGTAVTRSTIME